jgi:hypothetical protein
MYQLARFKPVLKSNQNGAVRSRSQSARSLTHFLED